jgi:hypothetical protein
VSHLSGTTRMIHRIVAVVVSAVLLGCGGDVSPPSAPDAIEAPPGAVVPTGPGVTSRFTRTGYAVTGTATLAIENGVARLDFSADFGIAQTPGPFVYLSTSSDPNMGTALRVSALRSRTGAQRYVFNVPAGIRYTRVLIWCDPFNVGMAEATIP